MIVFHTCTISPEMKYMQCQGCYVDKLREECEELKARLEIHRKGGASVSEEMRQARWWCTYNAALQGMYASGYFGTGADFTSEDAAHAVHNRAVLQADLAHGPLEKKP